eukprot:maker-scaffold290_size220039-snap-gene-1.12 protein:Tk02625 transcript:maker-scaffold290_size220039-snap-gene-1.12-mRNA-1 annotation:"PREDICTED: uncharacterized protein LOC101073771"
MVHEGAHVKAFPELMLFFPKLGKTLFPVTLQATDLEIPEWTNAYSWTMLGSKILACSGVSNECKTYTFGQADWADFPPPLVGHIQGALVTLGKVPVILGGADDPIESASNTRKVEFYNDFSNKWEFGPSLSEGKRLIATLVLPGDRLVAIGGMKTASEMTDTVELLQLGAEDWQQLNRFPKALRLILATTFTMSDGRVGGLAIGGKGVDPDSASRTAYILDPKTLQWDPAPQFDFQGLAVLIMVSCSAYKCSNRGEYGFKFYRFPRDPDRRKIWAIKVRRLKWSPTPNCRLCETHFDEDQFEIKYGKRVLKTEALPCFSPHETSRKRRKPPRERFHKGHASLLAKAAIAQDHSYPASKMPQSDALSHPVRAEKILRAKEVQMLSQTELASEEVVEVITKDHYVHKIELSLQAARKRISMVEKENALLKAQLAPVSSELSFFGPDECYQIQHRSMRGRSWNEDTIAKAQKIRSACGIAGYETLQELGYPLPSIRTLQRLSGVKAEG